MATKIRIPGQVNITGNIDLGGYRIVNSGDPVNSADLVTKDYVDNLAMGIKWKEPVRVASTENVSLNGSTPLQIDGVTMTNGDRVLLKSQTTASQNGIYVVSISGSTYTLNRSSDLPAGSSAASVACFVMEGTTNSDKAFVCTNDVGSDIVGTHDLTFITFTASISEYVAGNGIDITGNTISVKLLNNAGLAFDSGSLKFNAAANGGLNVDASGVSVKVNPNGGLQVDSDGISAKLVSDGGLLSSSNGLSVDPSVVAELGYLRVVNYVADGNQSSFSLGSQYVYHVNSSNTSIVVMLNGVVQKETDDYTVSAGNPYTITLTNTPANGDLIQIRFIVTQ